jgi:mRNA-degrading endonuclease RelE of RelBE toxin-antitoxin system
VEIIETPVFTRKIKDVLSDDEYGKLQWALVINPEAGAVIPGSGGLRKLRWAISGRGKRGGLRVIYYWYTQDEKIYMLLPYKKSEQEDLTNEQMRILNRYVKDGVL